MLTFYQSPNSRSTSVMVLFHELGVADQVKTVTVTIPLAGEITVTATAPRASAAVFSSAPALASGQVQPAGGLARLARQAGARVVVVNPEPTELDAVAHAILAGPSARLVPELLDF